MDHYHKCLLEHNIELNNSRQIDIIEQLKPETDEDLMRALVEANLLYLKLLKLAMEGLSDDRAH